MAATSLSGTGALKTLRILLTSASHAALGMTGWFMIMPTEWQAVQSALATSAPGPGGNVAVLSGSVTFVDFRTGTVCAACQLFPPSLEKSTCFTPLSPPKAMPRASVGAPTWIVAPDARLVRKERGFIRLIGTIVRPVWPGFMSALGVSGIV